MYVPGTIAMTGMIETDQIRRDFTFNLKITIPNLKISVRKGDALGAFIPMPRRYVDKFEIDIATNYFNDEIIGNEHAESHNLSQERMTSDKDKAHESGRRYFNGIHFDGKRYKDHQKKLI
jgi:hypothetical protein